MKTSVKVGYALLLMALLPACGNPDPAGDVCGLGEEVTSGDDVACVYRSELIEEGFACPAEFEVGFLLEGGGVACTNHERMPDGLGQELRGRGHNPENPNCFEDDPPPACFLAPPLQNNGTNNANNGTNNTNNGTNNGSSAFETDGAQVLSYRTGPGYGYCIEADALVAFSVDTTTLAATASIAVPGETNCLDDGGPECLVASEWSFELRADQLQELIARLDAVPAPMCVEDPGLVCDPCIVETLAVDATEQTADCCGDQTAADYGAKFDDVVAYMRSLVPEPQVPNPADFTTLTYTANPGDGYCIAAGDILAATLTRSADGSLALEGEGAVVADPATETCIADVVDGACLKREVFGPQTLTPEAQAELERRLGVVPEKMCLELAGMECDPCLVETVTVDGESFDGYCCGASTVAYDDAFSSLADHIQTLR